MVNHGNLVATGLDDVEVTLHIVGVLIDQKRLERVGEVEIRDIETNHGVLVLQCAETVNTRLEELGEITVTEQESTFVL